MIIDPDWCLSPPTQIKKTASVSKQWWIKSYLIWLYDLFGLIFSFPFLQSYPWFLRLINSCFCEQHFSEFYLWHLHCSMPDQRWQILLIKKMYQFLSNLSITGWMQPRPISLWGTFGLNSEFSFLWTGCLTMAKKSSLPKYIPIAGE